MTLSLSGIHNIHMKRIFTTILLMSLFSSQGFAASKMSTFLKSCAYGTLGGAVIGLGTLAVSENPGGKMSNVARGASLGLYAGIAYGFYVLNKKNEPVTDVELGENFIYFEPLAANQKIEGAQINWVPLSF